MPRRSLANALGAVAAAWPLAARAQPRPHPDKPARVGVLWHAGNAEEEREYLTVVETSFRELGYVQGRNLELLHRFPAEQPERFRTMARELVAAKPDVIIAVTIRGALEVKQATSTIPTVFILANDPVADGLVTSLAQPGGNMTGTSLMGSDLSGKRLALLRDAIPDLRRVAAVFDSAWPAGVVERSYRREAERMGLELRLVRFMAPADIAPGFAALATEGAQAAIVQGSMLFNERKTVGAASLASGLPALAIIGEMVPYGMLLSYGQDFPAFFRKAVISADKILRGATPASMPVEQPTRFKLIVNLQAAKAFGLTIPGSLLATADEIIE